MSNEELNMKIYEALLEQAKEVFGWLVPSKNRSFTASEVNAAFSPSLADAQTLGYIFWDEKKDGWKDYSTEEIVVCVGNFRCSISKRMVFSILHKFQKLCNIPQKQYYKFVKMEEKKNNFVIRIQNMANLQKSVKDYNDKYPNSPMSNVCLYTEMKVLAASDGFIARYEPYRLISGEIPKSKNGNYFAVPAKIKDGTYTVWYDDEPEVLTWTNEEGYQAEGPSDYSSFPNYRTVIPEVTDAGLLTFQTNELKAISKFVKSKNLKGNKLAFTLSAEAQNITINATDVNMAGGAFSISQETGRYGCAKCTSVFFLMKTEYMKLILSDWDGRMYYMSPNRALIFCTKTGGITLQMPCDPGDFLSLHPTAFSELQGSFDPISLIQYPEEKPEVEEPVKAESPTLKRRSELKVKHPDSILIFRVNHVYHIYGEDAVKADAIINMNGCYVVESHERFYKVSFPVSQMDMVISKLVRADYQIAIFDELNEPKRIIKSTPTPDPIPIEVLDTKPVEVLDPSPVVSFPKPETVNETPTESPRAADGVHTWLLSVLIIDTEEYGTIKVAGESFFAKLYDQSKRAFVSEEAAEKFNEIDAFVPDELISKDPLDFPAIGKAIDAFFAEVEAEQSRAVCNGGCFPITTALSTL